MSSGPARWVSRIAPVLTLRLRPAGRAPEVTAQRTAPTPPDEVNVAVYGLATCPDGSEVVVTANPVAPVISTELGVYAIVYGWDPKA